VFYSLLSHSYHRKRLYFFEVFLAPKIPSSAVRLLGMFSSKSGCISLAIDPFLLRFYPTPVLSGTYNVEM
jgi:hypothetical protein